MSASYKIWLRRGGLVEGKYKGSGLSMAMKRGVRRERGKGKGWDGSVGDGDRQSERN